MTITERVQLIEAVIAVMVFAYLGFVIPLALR